MWEIQFAIKVMMLTNLAAGLSRVLFIFGRLFGRVRPWKCFSLGQPIFALDEYIQLYSRVYVCTFPNLVPPLPCLSLPLLFEDDGEWVLRSFKLITYNFRVPKISKVLMDDLVHNKLTQPDDGVEVFLINFQFYLFISPPVGMCIGCDLILGKQ